VRLLSLIELLAYGTHAGVRLAAYDRQWWSSWQLLSGRAVSAVLLLFAIFFHLFHLTFKDAK